MRSGDDAGVQAARRHTVVAQRTWALVDAAQEGDTEAFGLLYGQYRDTVLRAMRRATADPVLAEDVTSETFLRAFRRLGTCTHRSGSFRAWLLMIAHHLLLDDRKSVRRRREALGLESVPEPVAPDDPARDACLSETRSVVRTRLARLTPLQRDCLTMRFLLGFSVSRTAAHLGRSPEAIRTLQFRALRELARHVSPDDVADDLPSASEIEKRVVA